MTPRQREQKRLERLLSKPRLPVSNPQYVPALKKAASSPNRKRRKGASGANTATFTFTGDSLPCRWT